MNRARQSLLLLVPTLLLCACGPPAKTGDPRGDIIAPTGRPSEISCREEPATWGSPSWRGATIGAVLGALAGGLIGGSMSDRWQEIPLEQVRVRVTKRRDGRFALGAAVRF